MPDEKPLDSHLDPEVAATEAELERLKRGEATETTAVPTGEEPVPEGKPEDAAAAAIEQSAEAKPVEETKPAVEAKPAETAKPEVDPEKAREGTLRRLLRNQDRELAELRREKAAREQQQAKPAEEAKAPTYDDDPAEFLRRKTDAQEAEINRLKAQNERDRTLDEIRRGEADLVREKPDYFQASDYLISSEIKEWDKSGKATVDVRRVMANPQTRGIIDNMAANPQFQDVAEREGRDPLDAAAWVVARDTHLLNRQQELIESARATGRSVAQVAYEMAGYRGYKTPEAKPAGSTEQAARDRVQHSRDLSDAARSLSESPSAEASPQPKVIRNRNQVLSLSDDELDAMIAQGSYRNL